VQSLPDKDLWDNFRQGDERAFNVIFLTHYDALYNYGRKLTADEDFVKDSIQELFQKLWHRRGTVGPVVIIKPYLFKALRRRIGDEATALRRRNLLQWAYQEEEFTVNYSHEDFLIAEQFSTEQGAKLLNALNELSNRQREAIYLKYFDGFSYERISEIMGLAIQSIRNLIHQAIKVLKTCLAMIMLLLLKRVAG
jgi:RNA polymerase sigma factor (sigma-70 family)